VSKSTADVTTLDNEIERHLEIAEIYDRLAALSDDCKMFTPRAMASNHRDIADRLTRLKATSPQTEEGS